MPPNFRRLSFGYSECGGGISSRPFFFKNNSSLENDLEPFKQPLNCMRCVCRVFLSKIIWNRFMVWTLCQNFGLKENLFSVVKYKSIIQLSLGFQCYSCKDSCFESSCWVMENLVEVDEKIWFKKPLKNTVSQYGSRRLTWAQRLESYHDLNFLLGI